MVEPSAEAFTTSACALSTGAQGSNAPVVTSKDRRWVRLTSLTPAAEPDGRALVKLPATKAVLPTTTVFHTTPLIWGVGSASALTVAGVPGGGVVSATAAGAVITRPAAASAAADTTAAARAEMFVDENVRPLIAIPRPPRPGLPREVQADPRRGGQKTAAPAE